MSATISTIVPVFNGAAYIAEAIASIAGQSRPPCEIIVVDDGSDDDGAQIAAATSDLVRVISQPNYGVDAARNNGAGSARGQLIHFFDADDILPPDALSAMADALEAQAGGDAAFGRWQNFWVEELAAERDAHASTALASLQKGLLPGTGLYRAEFLRKTMPFPIGERNYGFARWLVDQRDAGANFLRIDAFVLERRIHQNNVSRAKTKEDFADFAFDMVARAKRAAKQR